MERAIHKLDIGVIPALIVVSNCLVDCGAVVTQEAEDLTCLHLKGKIVYGNLFLEMAGEVVYSDNIIHVDTPERLALQASEGEALDLTYPISGL